MRRFHLPTATVLETTARFTTIDRGTREGFRVSDRVNVFRGRFQLNVGKIVKAERNRAEFTVERQTMGIAPGDRVQRLFDPARLGVGR